MLYKKTKKEEEKASLGEMGCAVVQQNVGQRLGGGSIPRLVAVCSRGKEVISTLKAGVSKDILG